MKQRGLTTIGAAVALAMLACGPSTPASSPPPPASATAPPAEPPSSFPSPLPSASAPPPASSASVSSAPAPASSAPAPASSAKPVPEVTTSVTAVSNEITTPAVVAPDRVISSLRPKFNACFADGLKKDPKTSGSVTLSAKIEKDGKVSAVTPKLLTGLSPAVVKCLSDHLKSASFAAAGGMNYTTSLDIPLSFTSNQ